MFVQPVPDVHDRALRCLMSVNATCTSWSCTQADEIRQMAGLSREAAELLWELTVMDDSAGAAEEMLQKAKLLQVGVCPLAGRCPCFTGAPQADALHGNECRGVNGAGPVARADRRLHGRR